jgi:UPF0716 protein FxsA
VGWLLILFIVVPAIEIFFLIEVGAVIGTMNTIMAIIATGVLGAHYARQQGIEVLTRLQRSMGEGKPPAGELIDGAMLLIGGAFLVTPGFVTDAAGFALILPFTRALIKRQVVEFIRRKIERGDIQIRRF